MANYWLGFATTGTRFDEGELLLVYDHAPNGAMENKIFAWVGPVDLTPIQKAAVERRVGVPMRKLQKAVLATIDAAYANRAFDPGVTVPPGEILVVAKAMLLAALENTGKTAPEG